MFDDSNYILDDHDDEELEVAVHEVTLKLVSFEICFGAKENISSIQKFSKSFQNETSKRFKIFFKEK